MESPNRVTNCLEHPLDLVLPALVDRELDPVRGHETRPGRRCPAVFELDSLGEATKRLGCGPALHLRDVHLVHLEARMHEPVGELAVVGEEQGSSRVCVESAHWDEAP